MEDRSDKNSERLSEDTRQAVDGHCLPSNSVDSRVDGHPHSAATALSLAYRILMRKYSAVYQAEAEVRERSDGLSTRVVADADWMKNRHDGCKNPEGADGSMECESVGTEGYGVCRSLRFSAITTATAPLDGSSIVPICIPYPNTASDVFTTHVHSTRRAAHTTANVHTTPPNDCGTVVPVSQSKIGESGTVWTGSVANALMDARAPEDRGADTKREANQRSNRESATCAKEKQGRESCDECRSRGSRSRGA